jgi:hypothetical protein
MSVVVGALHVVVQSVASIEASVINATHPFGWLVVGYGGVEENG